MDGKTPTQVRWLQGVGVGEVSALEIAEAKAHLFAWGQRADVKPAPAPNYGLFESDFLNPSTWTERDGIMLQGFARWWNGKNPPNKVPEYEDTDGGGPGPISIPLEPAHLVAMRSLSPGGLPEAGVCFVGCQQQYAAFPTQLVACLTACKEGASPPVALPPAPSGCPYGFFFDAVSGQCQPVTTTPPVTTPPVTTPPVTTPPVTTPPVTMPPAITPPTKKKDSGTSTALIVGGLVAAGAIAYFALGKSGAVVFSENPSIPKANIEWTKVDPDDRVELIGSVFVVTSRATGKRAVAFWGSRDAVAAQRWLMEKAGRR